MSANVHYLHPRQAEIGHFLRLGHTGYRNLENLLEPEIYHGRIMIVPIYRRISLRINWNTASDLQNFLFPCKLMLCIVRPTLLLALTIRG